MYDLFIIGSGPAWVGEGNVALHSAIDCLNAQKKETAGR